MDGSLASTASTVLHSGLPGVAILPQRLSEATTSAEVISLPLWNLTPLRSDDRVAPAAVGVIV